MQRGSDCTKAGLSRTESQAPPALWPAGLSLQAPGSPDPAWGSAH